MAIQPTPPGPRTPPRNKGLIAGLIKGKPMVNKLLIRPAISGGGTLGGGWLTIAINFIPEQVGSVRLSCNL